MSCGWSSVISAKSGSRNETLRYDRPIMVAGVELLKCSTFAHFISRQCPVSGFGKIREIGFAQRTVSLRRVEKGHRGRTFPTFNTHAPLELRPKPAKSTFLPKAFGQTSVRNCKWVEFQSTLHLRHPCKLQKVRPEPGKQHDMTNFFVTITPGRMFGSKSHPLAAC